MLRKSIRRPGQEHPCAAVRLAAQCLVRCIEVVAVAGRASPLALAGVHGRIGVAANASPFVVALDHIRGCIPFQCFKPRVSAIVDFRGFGFSIESLISAIIRMNVLPVKAKDPRDPRHDRVKVDEVAKAEDGEGQAARRSRLRCQLMMLRAKQAGARRKLFPCASEDSAQRAPEEKQRRILQDELRPRCTTPRLRLNC